MATAISSSLVIRAQHCSTAVLSAVPRRASPAVAALAHNRAHICQPSTAFVQRRGVSLYNRCNVVKQPRRTAFTTVAEAAKHHDGHPHDTGTLVLVRHGESLWNERNLFTGCVDVPLSEKGIEEALAAGQRISEIPIDMIFVSALMRAQMTAMIAMTQHRLRKVPVVMPDEAASDREKGWSRIFSDDTVADSIPVYKAWQLNERMYGELQGLNKKETADKYGMDQVVLWRRSFSVPPPNGESLEVCAQRAVKYYREMIEPLLQKGNNVMISAHGNSLRAIIMYLDNLTQEEVLELELSTGIPMVYELANGKYNNRGSPLQPGAVGVFAISEKIAKWKIATEQAIKKKVKK
eukprot:jgi/Mesvir1/3204/Mv16354-RA.1